MAKLNEKPTSIVTAIPKENLFAIPGDLRRVLREEYESGGIESDDFHIRSIYITGSRVQGRSRPSSDLDVVVEYTGKMREDDAFGMFARYRDEGRLYVLDCDGKRVKLDVNPIHPERTGTFAEYIGERPFAVLEID